MRSCCFGCADDETSLIEVDVVEILKDGLETGEEIEDGQSPKVQWAFGSEERAGALARARTEC